MTKEISVIIPVYNDYDGLRDTLSCLANQSIDRNKYEIIIANDGGDLQIKEIGKLFKARVLDIIPNQGAYKARNQAILFSNCENLAFTDADIKMKEDWLENGLDALKKADYVVGPVQIERKSKMKIFERYEYYSAFDMERYFNAFGFGGAGNLFVKKAVFEDLGYFEERLRSGGDGEFGRRVSLCDKYKRMFDSRIQVSHPLRSYQDMINKVKRVSKGIAMINKFRPKSLHPKMKPNIFKSCYHIFIPPNLFKTKYFKDEKRWRIFMFHWFYKALRGYYTIYWQIKGIEF